MENIELLPEDIIVPPTTQELINEALGKKLMLKTQLKQMDYLTHKAEDGEDMTKYGDYTSQRNAIRIEIRDLDAEVETLEAKLLEEQKQQTELK